MILIDGNNLWYAAMECGEPLAGISRHELVELLDDFARHLGQRVVVVLDGPPRPDNHSAGAAEHIYAGSRSADDVIAQLVADSTDPHRVTVVTSDRSLAKSVRRRRVKRVMSADFAARLETWANRRPSRGIPEPAGKVIGLGGVGKSVDDWLRFFHLRAETSDIIKGDRAAAAGGTLASRPDRSISTHSPSPQDEAGDGLSDELRRLLPDVQPLKRKRRRT